MMIRSLFPCLVFAACAIAAQPDKKDQSTDEKKNGTPNIAVPHSERLMSLAECLDIGANQQPTIKAAIASLKSTEQGLSALNKLGPAARAITPDLIFRKQQGDRGLIVGAADIEKAQQETKYDITRLYYTFVYARQQDATAEDIVKQLEVYYDVAKGMLNVPNSGMDRFKLHVMEEAINEVRKLRITARAGQSMSLAALKEAMGVDQSYDFIPKDTELPVMGGSVSKDQVVGFALSRRPELAMAAAGVDAFRLEVCAQQAINFRKKVQTLAIGSDLHSRLIPMPHRNGDYRPGALAPEMPATLVGTREDRVARACEIASRSEDVFDKTRNLISLEALNTFYNWEAATERMRLSKIRYESSKQIAKEIEQQAPGKKDQEAIIRFQAMAGKAQADYIEAVYEHIKQLATLERVTAGGVKPAFPDK